MDIRNFLLIRITTPRAAPQRHATPQKQRIFHQVKKRNTTNKKHIKRIFNNPVVSRPRHSYKFFQHFYLRIYILFSRSSRNTSKQYFLRLPSLNQLFSQASDTRRLPALPQTCIGKQVLLLLSFSNPRYRPQSLLSRLYKRWPHRYIRLFKRRCLCLVRSKLFFSRATTSRNS